MTAPIKSRTNTDLPNTRALTDLAFSSPNPSRLVLIVALIGSAILSIFLWHENLHARFGLIDDHETARLIGPDGSLPWREVIPTIKSTEAGYPGQTLRYRPAYYALRTIECAAWGLNPTAWYAARLLMFFVVCAITWWLFAQAIGLLVGSLLTMLLFTEPYWGPIWAALGPAETYAAFGLALFALGAYLLASGRVSGRGASVSWLLVAAGSLIAAGSKENFTLLAPLVLLLAAHRLRSRSLALGHGLLALLLAGFCGFVYAAVRAGTQKAGTDIYAGSAGLWARLQPALNQVSLANPFLLLAAAGLVLYFGARYIAGLDRNLIPMIVDYARTLALAELALFGGHFALVVFYNGAWERSSRYAFPGEILVVLAFVTPLALIGRANLLPSAIRNRALAYLSAALLVALWLRGFSLVTNYAHENRLRTESVSAALQRLSNAAQHDPAAPLILYTHGLVDYEALFAMQAFISNLGLKNPLMAEKDPGYYTRPFPQALAAQLVKDIDDVVAGGRGFVPRTGLREGQHCFRIGFGTDPPPGPCESLGRVAR